MPVQKLTIGDKRRKTLLKCATHKKNLPLGLLICFIFTFYNAKIRNFKKISAFLLLHKNSLDNRNPFGCFIKGTQA